MTGAGRETGLSKVFAVAEGRHATQRSARGGGGELGGRGWRRQEGRTEGLRTVQPQPCSRKGRRGRHSRPLSGWNRVSEWLSHQHCLPCSALVSSAPSPLTFSPIRCLLPSGLSFPRGCQLHGDRDWMCFTPCWSPCAALFPAHAGPVRSGRRRGPRISQPNILGRLRGSVG